MICLLLLCLLPSLFQLLALAQVVVTVAGTGVAGFLDGSAGNARFDYITGLTVDVSANLIICDRNNKRIRKLSPNGTVSTIAGSGITGFVDGNSIEASFNEPFGVVSDSNGNIYVTDTGNFRVRKIAPNGSVSVMAGSSAGFADGIGVNARFDRPAGITIDMKGNLFLADRMNRRVRKISPDGNVSTVAGAGCTGFLDGVDSAACFEHLLGITIDVSGSLFVCDRDTQRIRKISNGMVSTVAGSSAAGFADGNSASARFNYPRGVTADSSGTIFVADTDNHRIRKILPNGEVSTIAGWRMAGFADGIASEARFNEPFAIAADAFGDLYVSEIANQRIRKIILPQNIPPIVIPSSSSRVLSQKAFGLTIQGGELSAVSQSLNGDCVGAITPTSQTIRFVNSSNTVIHESSRLTANASYQTGGILMKLSRNKTVLWEIHFDGDGNDVIQDLAQDDASNVYVTGVYTDTFSIFQPSSNMTLAVLSRNGTSQNGFIVKFAPNGTILWVSTVRGNPFSISVSAQLNSAIVAIKFSIPPSSSCIIEPAEGEPASFTSELNGQVILKLSPSGQIIWSKLVNFIPWDDSKPFAISQNGEISFSGWCFPYCRVYNANDTSISHELSNNDAGRNVATNLVFDSNGDLKISRSLHKYIRIQSHQEIHFQVTVQNATISLLSIEDQVTIDVKEWSTVDIFSNGAIFFVSVDGKMQLTRKLATESEFLLDFPVPYSTKLVLFKRIDSKLGPFGIQGALGNGTFSFDIDAQFGYWTNFSLSDKAPNDFLVRFQPVQLVDFICGFRNETHGLFYKRKPGLLEITLEYFSNSNITIELNRESITVSDDSELMLAWAFSADHLSFFANANLLFQRRFTNPSDFLFSTVNGYGSVKHMAIMDLPEPIESWLVVPIELTSSTTAEASPTIGSTDPTTTELIAPSSSVASTDNDKNVLAIFGLSGTLLYIALAGFGSVILLLIITTIILGRRCRRSARTEKYNDRATLFQTTNFGTNVNNNTTLVNQPTQVFWPNLQQRQ